VTFLTFYTTAFAMVWLDLSYAGFFLCEMLKPFNVEWIFHMHDSFCVKPFNVELILLIINSIQ
jgi:hypothetical protein